MTSVRKPLIVLTAGALVTLLVAGGCGSNTSTGLGDGVTPTGSATVGDSGLSKLPSGLSTGDGGQSGFNAVSVGDATTTTQNASCTPGTLGCFVRADCVTTMTGTVRDPAGRNPIYNAVVFIPQDPKGTIPPITPGTKTCNTCDVSIGNYVAAAQTDYKGNFKLTGVPATKNVPLVVQIGKWRREVVLPTVTACTNNVVAAANSRLPAKKSEGDMPQMALLTGGADDLGCFMAGLGIDPSEWTPPQGGGRLDVYRGVGGEDLASSNAGDCTGSTCPLWSTKPDLEHYDIAILACEGGENNQTKSAAQKLNMHDWLDEGGKVFATHFHYTWFKNGPADFQGTATWLGSSNGDQTGTYPIDTSFPKGMVLQEWLANLGFATGNSIALNGVANSVSTVNPPTQRWIYDSSNNNDVKYMSFLTPIGGMKAAVGADASTESGPKYCGKAVFSDLHAGGAPPGGFFFGGGASLPGSCNTSAALTAQEAALEFLFFDLSACVADESKPPPMIPPPTQPAQ
ncbi:MAG: hypothetical protein ACREJ3_01515 [Polyangiaceae bacterium]